MWRVSIRKIFLYFAIAVSFFVITINVHIRHNNGGLLIISSGEIKTLSIEPEVRVILGENVPLSNITNSTSERREGRPWYMKDGEIWPHHCPVNSDTGEREATLFPEEAPGDRMISQLMFLPPVGTIPTDQDSPEVPLKKILFWTGASGWGVKPGRGVFLKEKCPVSTCVISTRRKDSGSSDLIIFKDHFIMPSFERPKDQIWLMFMLESPLNTQKFKHPEVFNWTATYRSDSTLVTPYERWQYYEEDVKFKQQNINYAANKTKKVAWFVSNCAARNGRLDYAKKLSQFIDVDIYGSCGTKRCPRTNSDCHKKLNTEYKFYLAFENSNCKDYITEKFYVNGLKNDILPVVMGARKEDYLRSAPQKSFIHVDDFDSPEDLAKYLEELDRNDDLYNEYFQWKGTGEMINTKFFCRLCSLLHDPKKRAAEYSNIRNINGWWRGRGNCITGSWRKYQEKLQQTNVTKEIK